MTFVIKLGKLFLKFIYFVMKLFPTKNKVLFLSRQSNNIPLDFELIVKEIKKEKYDIKVICQRLEGTKDTFKQAFKFIGVTLKSMYHLATCRVCIIDSYCIPVSILKHKKSLTVIQIWHAMGKIKQTGYQTLGKRDGRNPKMAKALELHKNYNIVIAGAKAWNFAYCASFGIEEDKLWNIGLPRAAYIYNNMDKIKNKIYKKYPEFKKKKVILYSPTFRANKNSELEALINNVDYDKYHLIVTGHPKHPLNVDDKKVYRCHDINIYELLTICDYFICDYGSLAVEAAAINKKTYYYLYDYEDYMEGNGLNFDPLKELPTLSFKKAEDLLRNLNEEKYDIKAFREYRQKFVPKDFELATKKIGKYIKEKMK